VCGKYLKTLWGLFCKEDVSFLRSASNGSLECEVGGGSKTYCVVPYNNVQVFVPVGGGRKTCNYLLVLGGRKSEFGKLQ